MRATLVGDESYDIPPRLGSGVFVAIKGVVHVVRENYGIRVRMYCTDTDTEAWKAWKTLEQGWYEAPTCVRCATHPGAAKARFFELQWREEWWTREGNGLRTPWEVEPVL